MPIIVDFEKLRIEKDLTVAELSGLVGITQANLFVLKNNRGKAIRFSTLEAFVIFWIVSLETFSNMSQTSLTRKEKLNKVTLAWGLNSKT